MNKLATLSSATALSLLIASSVTATAYAWHPQGKITKSVQNITTNSDASDANTEAAAVSAKPGDVLKYTITVENIAPAADKHYNDLAFTTLADILPAGIEQVENAQVRTLTADLGTILPGKSVTKTYTVKVTATTNGVITNEACFYGDSVVKDNPKTGCDVALVKVIVPEVPVTPPTPPVTPETPATPPATTPGSGSETPAAAALPNVGTGIFAPIAGLATAVAGYGANLLRIKRRKR